MDPVSIQLHYGNLLNCKFVLKSVFRYDSSDDVDVDVGVDDGMAFYFGPKNFFYYLDLYKYDDK